MKAPSPLLVATIILMVGMQGCSKLEVHARDTAGALNGAIVQAQKQHQAECNENPSQAPCVIINKAVDGQNTLITAVETYCGWSVTNPPADMTTAQCVKVGSAEAGLKTAIANADLFIAELKGVIK